MTVDLEQVDGAGHVVLIIPQRLGHTLAHGLQSSEVDHTGDPVLRVAVCVKHLKCAINIKYVSLAVFT